MVERFLSSLYGLVYICLYVMIIIYIFYLNFDSSKAQILIYFQINSTRKTGKNILSYSLKKSIERNENSLLIAKTQVVH